MTSWALYLGLYGFVVAVFAVLVLGAAAGLVHAYAWMVSDA